MRHFTANMTDFAVDMGSMAGTLAQRLQQHHRMLRCRVARGQRNHRRVLVCGIHLRERRAALNPRVNLLLRARKAPPQALP